MAAEDSYIFHALQFLSASKRRRTAKEILDYLHQLKDERAGFLRRSRYVPDSEEDLENVLLSLEKFGVVKSGVGRSNNYLYSPRVWEIGATPAQREPRQPDGGGGNGDGGRGDGGGGGDAGGPGAEGDGGGAGLSEVLGHPVLFCLSDAQQDRLLMEALGLPPDDGNTGDGGQS